MRRDCPHCSYVVRQDRNVECELLPQLQAAVPRVASARGGALDLGVVVGCWPIGSSWPTEEQGPVPGEDKHLAQAADCLVHPALDGAAGNSQHVGSLALLEPLVNDQDEHLP